jgi:FMN phosphatase YigB (HAD superfamily)
VIGAVVFDVGECLVDESREYGTWADWLGVPRHVFSAVFGAVIARGQDYRETFQVFRPGFDLDKARQQRPEEGKPEWFGDEDLYPDVRPALARLRETGLWVGIAGNQTARGGGILRDLGLPADMIATSDDWGVTKPDPGFFRGTRPSAPMRRELGALVHKSVHKPQAEGRLPVRETASALVAGAGFEPATSGL